MCGHSLGVRSLVLERGSDRRGASADAGAVEAFYRAFRHARQSDLRVRRPLPSVAQAHKLDVAYHLTVGEQCLAQVRVLHLPPYISKLHHACLLLRAAGARIQPCA